MRELFKINDYWILRMQGIFNKVSNDNYYPTRYGMILEEEPELLSYEEFMKLYLTEDE